MEVFISICGILHKNNKRGLSAERLTEVLCLASAQGGWTWRSADGGRAPWLVPEKDFITVKGRGESGLGRLPAGEELSEDQASDPKHSGLLGG